MKLKDRRNFWKNVFKIFEESDKLSECPQPWQSGSVVSALNDKEWDAKKGRRTILAAVLPNQMMESGFAHGYVKACYEVYEEVSHKQGQIPESLSSYSRHLNEALVLKSQVANKIVVPKNPKTIR